MSEVEDLRIIIPVGGEARRLKPLTCEISKALVRLLNRPLVEVAIVTLARQGVKNFIFGVKGYVNYRSLHDYFQDGTGLSAKYGISPRIHIKYQPNEEDVGSADSARINIQYYDIVAPIVGVQGDNIFDIDLANFLRFHREKKALMTIGLTYVENVEDYGVVELDKDFRIRRFVEKPPRDQTPSNLANTGIYLLSPNIREVFKDSKVKEMIEKSRRLDFGLDLIPYLIQSGAPVYGYILKGEWYDVGTPQRYLNTMINILHNGARGLDIEGRVSEKENIWIQGESPESLKRREEVMRNVKEGKVKLEGAVLIGRHCHIGTGTVIKDSCVDNFCTIGKNVRIEKSAVMDRVAIGDGAEIRDSIVGRHVRISSSLDNPSCISEVSVIGDDVIIGKGCEIVSTRIFPHKIIPDNRRMLNEYLE
ncbi:MAG: sugar phosphate nucleotidyltransferase [Nitrososphaeria archaeon]